MPTSPAVAGPRPRVGVFDSGVGGLTVLRALRARAPHCDYVYLGDTARLPYGTKSPDTVRRYAVLAAAELVARQVDLLVVACNTASAFALDALRNCWPGMPVVGVVEPGADAAVHACGEHARGHLGIGVLATESTVRSEAYLRAVAARGALPVRQRACSVFVALAEEGWHAGDVARSAARAYLQGWYVADAGPAVLLLGCTHFPLLHETLCEVLAELGAPETAVVDSATTAAERVAEATLVAAGVGAHRGRLTLLATDGVERFAQVGARFLGEAIATGDVELVDLGPQLPS